MASQKKDAPVPPGQWLLEHLLAHYRLGITDTAVPFACHKAVPSVMISMDELADRLGQEYTQARRSAPPAEALNGAVRTAQSFARGAPQPEKAWMRVARYGHLLYLDLGRKDGACVQICPGRWDIVPSPPFLLFRRTAMTSELPLPSAGYGSMDGIRGLINLPGGDEWALYIACRIASLFPDITHPIESFTGPAGAAKTTTTRITADWIDPSPSMTPSPRDSRTWASMAAGRYTQPVDNLSYIPGWLSDLFCKSASGDGWVDRALYTDGALYVSKFRNVVLLNGIEFGSPRGDMGDRLIPHSLDIPEVRRSDDEITDIWEREHPYALAWLLDKTAEVLGIISTEGPPRSEQRLVRFAQIVRIVDSLWNTQAYTAWMVTRGEVMESAVLGDPVALAISRVISGPWEGSASDLLDLLVNYGGLRPPGGAAEWTPARLANALRRAEGPLSVLGWQISRRKTRGTRIVGISPPGAVVRG